MVFRDPLDNLASEAREGVEAALTVSLNEHTRRTKRRRLGFSTSEDALTWTVFAWLARDARPALERLGERLFGLPGAGEPTVLLWGAPVPPSRISERLRDGLVRVLDRLGENPQRRSEPDVVIDFGIAGVAFIEVKWRSGNDQVRVREKFERYVRGSPAFVDAELAKDSGLYELVRNWRIGWDLAAGRPFRLVNLGPESLFDSGGLQDFARAVPRGSHAQFQPLTWTSLLSTLEGEPGGIPGWLSDWLHERLVA